jgi:serine/threonine-protein kinase
LKDALRVAVDVCEGLGLVHDQGVIHRDLKSANIMLCGEGNSLRAVLMDFGLAHDFGSDHSSPEGATDAPRNGATVSGAIVGTPAYMAPEQFEGTPVSPATDIYALGIVLYELVTALHPYAAPTPVAAAIRRAQHPAPPSSLIRSIPHKWDRIIQRCLQ